MMTITSTSTRGISRFLMAFVVASCTSMTARPAQAQVVVQEVVRYFKPKQRPVENVLLKNLDDKRSFSIATEIMLETNSGGDDRTQTPTKDLIVAPPSFAIKAGETKLTRLVLTKPADPDKERIYRVRFQPATIKEKAADNEVKGVKTEISFVTTTGMLILVSPLNPKPNLTYTRDAESIVFKNEGNVTIDLRRFDNYCFDEAQTDCMDLPGFRLYPGREWRVEIPGSKPLRYNYAVYDNMNSITIDAAQ